MQVKGPETKQSEQLKEPRDTADDEDYEQDYDDEDEDIELEFEY